MKNYKFTTQFKNGVKSVMSELGLNEIENKRAKEGTMLFLDIKTGSIYGFYESGYCRRLIPTHFNTHWGTAQTILGRNYQMYQLNPTNVHKSGRKSRILSNPVEQLGLVVNAIARIRKTNI
jgi:hypothetical protein